jgi:cyclomaltodextrinase / maltogenic alpha-amylase / neopullulanase
VRRAVNPFSDVCRILTKRLNGMSEDVNARPEWVREAVFYQIFPDRFYNGTPINDADNKKSWGSEPNPFDTMGGDLEGVLQRLDYLRDLGVNALYLNPIFASESNHGYDTTDYYRIDPRFGNETIFRELVTKTHELGWHLVLDGVFNHTGQNFHAFKDLLEKGENSPFKDWYYVKKFPLRVEGGQDTYETFSDIASMPKLNTQNPDTRKYLCDVATYWIREFGIDGWRLDAPMEVPHDFWRDFRKAVKEVRADAFLLGEIWENLGEWVQGDMFDAVMNYQWRGATFTYFAQNEMSPTEFDNTLRGLRDACPPEANDRMLNMLSSHDADRLSTRCKDNALLIGQCVLFQMTYPGVPCIYYGDEIGTEGNNDPDNRRAFNWETNQWDGGLREFYKNLIRLRHEHIALRRGGYRTVLVHDDHRLFGYLREYDNEKIMVLFNSSEAEQCAEVTVEDLGTEPFSFWMDTGASFKQDGATLYVKMPPRGIALLGRN